RDSRPARFPTLILLLLIGLAGGCRVADQGSVKSASRVPQRSVLDASAESYVRLVLALGEHDPDYVDAYYGPDAWRAEAKAHTMPLTEIQRQAYRLIAALNHLDLHREEELVRLRQSYLVRQLKALATKAEMLGGRTLTFDQESLALYDAVAPTYTEEH